MRFSYWGHVAVLSTAVVLVAILFVSDLSQLELVGGLCSVLLLATGWLVLRRRAQDSLPHTIALTAIILISAGAGTAFLPAFAIVQCVAFPVLWIMWQGVRPAIVTSAALAAAVFVGLLIAVGSDGLVRSAITEILSLAFAIVMGLWFTRVYHLVEERQKLINQLQDAQQQVAALSRDAGAASERERLTREIHDTIAQDLTGLILTAQRSRRELRSGNVTSAHEQLHILEDSARSALAETRALVASGSAVGPDGGLTIALGRLGERFERETGMTVIVRAGGTESLDRDSEVVLLRCAQEALANVRKHSGASAASVTITTTHDSVVLRVADDGTGFDTATASTGFGLSGMRQRLDLVHGSLEILSEPGRGTSLIATLPAAIPTAA